MNKYLLLRDNKESGPYTADEIITKGIKPYDLVWMEGKSAAWRYPSEIEELKPYAPVIEEQPFDRFYKKPAESPVSAEQTYTLPAAVYTPISSDHTPYLPKEPAPSKKIYINFPGSRVETAISPMEKRNEASLIHSLPASGPTVNERAMAEKSLPAREEMEILSKQASLTPEANFRNGSAHYPASPKQKTSLTQNAFRWTIAACLLLGGILIGLSISYNKQSSNISQMNAIIRQIQQREKQQSAQHNEAPEMIRQAVQELSAENTRSVASGDKINRPAETTKQTPVGKTSTNNATAHSAPLQQLSTENSAGNITIPLKEVKEEKTTSALKPAKEPSRENLFKLLSIKSNKYKTGVLGGISNLQLELTNNSLVNLQQVEVEVKYLGPEKKIVRSQTVYFQDIQPGGQLTVNVPKSSRGISVEYMISKIN